MKSYLGPCRSSHPIRCEVFYKKEKKISNLFPGFKDFLKIPSSSFQSNLSHNLEYVQNYHHGVTWNGKYGVAESTIWKICYSEKFKIKQKGKVY